MALRTIVLRYHVARHDGHYGSSPLEISFLMLRMTKKYLRVALRSTKQRLEQVKER